MDAPRTLAEAESTEARSGRAAAGAGAGAVAHAPARRTDYDMESYMPLLMLTLCACGHGRGEPLPAALQRRSDTHGVYARDFARGYKPYAYAALSLHSPIPVLHVLSRVPLNRPPIDDLRTSASDVMPMYAHPYNPYMYATSMSNFVQDSYTDSDEPTILYARPNPKGGYSYRRRPTKKRLPRPETEPIIIRVHKYRIIRDR